MPQVWKRAWVRGLVGGVGVARPQRRRVRMSQVLWWQRRLLVAAIALALSPVSAEIGQELLVCGDGNIFDCNGGDADTSAASEDLRGCIQPVDVIQFAPTADTVVAHNNLAYASCNPRDNGGGLWNDCQGTESRFCKVGANTAIGEIEAIGHIDAHGSPPADNQVTGLAQWLGGQGKHYDDPDACSPAELADPNQESCINGFDFIGRNNDDCMEGMVFDNASPDLENFQVRINSLYGIFLNNDNTGQLSGTPHPGQAINPYTLERYPPWQPRNPEYAFLGEKSGSYVLDIHMAAPKSGGSPWSWDDNRMYYYDDPPGPGKDGAKRVRVPVRWSFWQGVGPAANKIIVPWMALTFYDMDDIGNYRNADECVRVVGAYAFARYSKNGLDVSTSKVRLLENRDVYVDDAWARVRLPVPRHRHCKEWAGGLTAWSPAPRRPTAPRSAARCSSAAGATQTPEHR